MAFSESHKQDTSDKKYENSLHFLHLPAYAKFLLEHQLEAYAQQQLQYSFEENVPLLKFIAHLPEEKLAALSLESALEFLTFLAENRCSEFIENSTLDFVNNRIQIIESEEIIAEDITIITFIRRKVLRRFLVHYSTEFMDFVHIMEDVDRFVAASEASSFKAFIQLQQDKINRINAELEHKQDDLLEAQKFAEMGSFLWDMKTGNSSYTQGVMDIFEIEENNSLDVFMQHVHEDDRDMVNQALGKAFHLDGLYECEYRYIKNNKEKRIWTKGVVKFEVDKPVSMKGTIMDVTHQYHLLNELQKSEEANKLAQSLTHIGNWEWDIISNEVIWSDEMYRIYGLEPQSEDITFERFKSLIHPDDRDERLADIELSLKTLEAEDYIMRIMTSDGQIKVLKGKGEVVCNKNKKVIKIVGTCQDITMEHHLYGELKNKESYLQDLIRSAPDAVVVFDKNYRINLWNPKAENIFGWRSEEVIGQTLTNIIIPDKKQNEQLHAWQTMLNSEEPNETLELVSRNKNNTEFYISLTISKSMQEETASYIAFIRDITNEKQTQSELQAKTQQLKKLNTSLELKNDELQRINKELESFNYIASHDLQEPLRKIQTFIQLILEKGKDNLAPNTVEYFNKIMTSSARMKKLIEDLLMFSQTTAKVNNFEPVDLNLVLDEVKIILSTLIEEKKVQIFSDPLPSLRAIPFQIQQLFLNLLSNAIKYAKENVTPQIRITCGLIKAENISDAAAIAGKVYFELRVEDNGIGFDEENAEKIFGLFQRLHNKDKYSGTGIGLAICKKIVHNHNGLIKAGSEPGKGSTFYIYLPKDLEIKEKTNKYLVN